MFEELAEDLRLFYVALTRAKYRCYLNWADVRTKERANDSAMAYLFEFADCDFAGQQRVLQALATAEPDLFEYRLLSAVAAGEPAELSGVRRDPELPLAYRSQTRSLHSIWQMS
ncbi:hypothetical protein, partial [Methylomonas koyamae]|uniref:hypothetical protein n=1 Tax=Methylomonas koyamae TaxID=702114 RepID=UPI000AC1CDB4